MRGLGLAAAIILAGSLTGCHNSLCDNESPAEHPSPDGKWKYVTFDRNCGATTANNFQVSIVPASAPLPNESANAFSGDYNHGATPYVAEVAWIGPNTLQISYSSKARVFQKEPHVGPIEIKYVVKP